MPRVSIKEVRRRLSELVDAVEQGETIAITRRGRVVAQLRPARPRVRPRLPGMAAFRAGIAVKGRPLSKTVSALRAEGRY